VTNPATNPGGPVVSQAWAGNVSLDDLNQASRLNGTTGAQQSTNAQRFWSSPARSADSTIREVFQVSLANARKINAISFDVAAFPHELTLEYFDPQVKAWVPCLEATAADPTPVLYTVLDSVPQVLPSISSVTGHLHPQHSFSGHWRSLNFDVRPFESASLRIILGRTTRGTAPVSTLGTTVDYSLGIRNFNIGYSVKSFNHVPYTLPNPNSPARGTFASTTDMFGSVVDFSIRINEARNVLGPDPTSSNSLTTVWKSEPQPIPWAVVNFYVDARELNGDAQVLDRFYIEPLYDGPTCNLYYSNDTPTSEFRSNSDPFPAAIAVVHNSAGVPGPNVLKPGPGTPLGSVAFVEVDNRGLDFDPSHQWWIGGRLNFHFAHGTQSGNNPILDCGVFSIAMTPLGLRFSTKYGDTLVLAMDAFDPATGMTFVVSCDGSTVTMAARAGLLDYQDSLPLSVPLKPEVPSVRVGAFQGDTPGAGDFDLTELIIKVDTTADEFVIGDFLTTPEPYVLASVFMGVNDPKTDNAILRYHYSLSTYDFPTGMIGGVPDRYHDLNWAPIARDYVLRKGFLYFPPTKAKYWKFEFCNLSPQTYEVYQAVQKKVQTFPAGMWISHLPKQKPLSSSVVQELLPGSINSYVVNSLTQTLDNGRTAIVGTGGTGLTTINAQARVIYDNGVRENIGSSYWAWNFLPLHSSGGTPSFEQAGPHNYEVIDFKASAKLAYFVGLRTVQAYRLDYLSTDDTDQYVEMFHDLTNVSTDGNWVLNQDHQLTSGSAPYAEARSLPINTNRIITAVQFAAQQSEPTQLLPDDGFKDQALTTWETVGDAIMTPNAGTSVILPTTVRIDRSLPPLTWDGVVETYPNWDSITTQSASWDDVQRGTQNPANSGGISSKPVTVPTGGRVHVAGRVTAPADLTSPLFVQIVDDSTGYVVSESPANVRANKIVEWYTSYTINDASTAVPFRWKDFSTLPTTFPMSDSFAHPNATILPPMDTGNAWSSNVDNLGNPLSLAISSNKAVVTSEGQYNYVNTGAIWGTLQFKVGTMGTTSAGNVWLALLSPFYLDNSGVLSNAAGNPFAGSVGNVLTTNQSARAVQANDVIRIDVIPTIYVPVGKEDVARPTEDPTYFPYSLMFYLNGTWVRTFSHNLGARPMAGIKGRLNQQFLSWSWTPASYGIMTGQVIRGMPRTANGAWLDPTSQTIWVDGAGRRWSAVGSWDTTTAVETAGADNIGYPLAAASDGAVMYVDTGVYHGSMSAYVRNIAGIAGTAQPAGRHGNVFCLDYDHGVYLDALGRVVQNGVVQGTLFPSGLTSSAVITVQFIYVSNVAPSKRNGVDPTVYPNMLVGRINGALAGTFASSAMQTWTGTKRGLAGDLYNPNGGSRPAGASYTLDTAFQSFNWAPDASTVAANGNAPTWDNVTQKGSISYDDLTKGTALAQPQLRARIVQKGPSNDIWDVDALSMYADPIVWYFANDGGYSFQAAYEIRNNPDGVMAFPTSSPVTNLNQKQGTSLVWRVISYAPGSTVSNLVIRPWYGGMLSGITHRTGLMGNGPNVMPYDHFGDIRKDSRFQTWNLPIPRSWWYSFQIIQRSQANTPITTSVTTSAILLSQTLITDPGGS
jgi:hypothetical protein